MPAPRPARYLNWTDGSPSKVQQPTTSLALQGYVKGEPPAFQNFNYIIWLLDQWVQFLDQQPTVSAYQRWVDPTGTYGTDTTLASAQAALSLTGGIIYLMTNLNLGASTFDMTVGNISLIGFPNATLSGSGLGIKIDTEGVRIKNLRMSGFTTAIQITNNNNFNFVTECRFASCTTEIQDNNATPNNVFANNLSE